MANINSDGQNLDIEYFVQPAWCEFCGLVEPNHITSTCPYRTQVHWHERPFGTTDADLHPIEPLGPPDAAEMAWLEETKGAFVEDELPPECEDYCTCYSCMNEALDRMNEYLSSREDDSWAE